MGKVTLIEFSENILMLTTKDNNDLSEMEYWWGFSDFCELNFRDILDFGIAV